jgi:hemoglobin
MTQSLYEQLGGEGAVNAAVDIFYKRVMADAALSPFFAGVDMPKQIKKQKSFLTYAFGGPNHYSGKGLRNAHRHLVEEKGLNDSHFDKVAGHLQATLTELGVSQPLIARVMEVAGSTRNDVLNK